MDNDALAALLELLAAMTLFSLVVMTLYSGFRLGSRSWEATKNVNEATSEVRLASAFIRRQLGKAIPLVVIGWLRQFRNSLSPSASGRVFIQACNAFESELVSHTIRSFPPLPLTRILVKAF